MNETSKFKTLPNGKIEYHGEIFSNFNKPKMTPDHPKKKAVVLANEGQKIKIIRFGAQGYGHNYSDAARKPFKARHALNIARGKMSAAYWADKYLWAGEGKRMKKPHKWQNGKY